MRAAAGALIAALLAGCQQVSAPTAVAPPVPAFSVQPYAGGLRIEGSGREVSFGRAEAGAVAAIESQLGPATGPLPCATGAREWRFANGLRKIFTSTQFTGWRDAEGRMAGATCS